MFVPVHLLKQRVTAPDTAVPTSVTTNKTMVIDLRFNIDNLIHHCLYMAM